MNPIRLYLLILVSGLPALHAQTNGIDQTLDIVTAPTGEKLLQWQAKAGRSYFLQVSDPADHLNKWYWYPLIESGSGQSISHEIEATADKRFFRLHYTDQTATDLDNADFDGDGLTNLQEITPVIRPGTIAARTIGGGSPPPNTTQTNPLDGDTDHDGLSDKFERDNGLDPTDNGSIDPNNGPNGDPDGDGISNGSEQTLGTNATNLDSDGDSLADSEDADPREILVNWSKASESSYVMIDLDVPSDAGDACDLNDESEVLFENGIWAGGEWISKTPPEVTGIIPENPENPDDEDIPYEIEFTGWTFFNNDRTLTQRAWVHPTEGQGVDSRLICPIFWPNGQSHPSVIYETANRWRPYMSHTRALGVSSNGDMAFRVTDYPPSFTPILQHPRIERYNAQGAAAGIMDGTDGFHPVGLYGNGQMTPSGWVVSNLSRDASVTQPAATKIGLWDSSNAAVPLPEQAEEGGYPVTATDMPNGKVAVIAGLGTEGRVFLPNATGQYQYVPSLAAGRLERFAGDGTAITQDGQLWRNGKLTPLRDLCKRYGELLDADWTFRTLKANKQGIYLIKALGPDGEEEAKLVMPMMVRGYVTKERSESVGIVNGNNVVEKYRGVTPSSTDYTGFQTAEKSELKIAQWDQVFEYSGDWEFNHGEFKNDVDIFRVRLPKISPPQGMAEHRVKIWTVDDAGVTVDPGAEVDLNVFDDFHESAALCLVADDATDDNFAVEGKQDGALGDRTYRAKLGGMLKVQWLTAPGSGPKPILEIPIPVKKTVTMQGYILKTETGNPAVDTAVATESFKRAHKIMAAVGVKLDYTVAPVAANPDGVKFGGLFGAKFDIPFSPDNKRLHASTEVQALMGPDGITPTAGVIPVYFASSFSEAGVVGITTVASVMHPDHAGYANAIFLNGDAISESTLAHELLHVVLDATHDGDSPLWFQDHKNKVPWCLWSYKKSQPIMENGILARRRILDAMRSRLTKSSFCK